MLDDSHEPSFFQTYVRVHTVYIVSTRSFKTPLISLTSDLLTVKSVGLPCPKVILETQGY